MNALTAEGIYYAMVTGELAARAAIDAIQAGNFASAQLRGYERAWKREIGDELANSVRLQKLLLADPARIDRIVRAASRHAVLADLLARYATGALTHAQFKRSMLRRALPVYRARENAEAVSWLTFAEHSGCWRALFSLLVGSLFAFQRQFREYPGIEYERFSGASGGAQEKTEFAFARLMYPPAPTAMFDRAGPRWAEGMSSWTQDYPRADRHFLLALRRLTRIHARSVEQPVNLDDGDDVYNWPWLYAVRPGEWQLTDAQAHKLRDYLLRGGFFMADDFWGTPEWAVFWDSMGRVFPDRQAVELENTNRDIPYHLRSG